MALRWNGSAVSKQIEGLAWKELKAWAQAAVKLHQKNLNTPYPPASKPGEFPHRRTGKLRRSVLWRNRKKWAINIRVEAAHAVFLAKMGRKGLADTLKELKRQGKPKGTSRAVTK